MSLLQNGKNQFLDDKRTIIAVQWVVVLAVSFLFFYEGTAAKGWWPFLIVLVLLASSLALYCLPRHAFSKRYFPHALLIVNTLLVSAGIAVSGEKPWDLFLIFFVGLFISAIGDTLIQTCIGSVIVCIISVFISNPSSLNQALLLRIPFLFGVLLIYAYLAQRIKEEKTTTERLAVLRDINLVTASNLDLNSNLNLLLAKIDRILPSAAVMVWLMNKESGLYGAACRNIDEGEWKASGPAYTPSLILESHCLQKARS